MAMYSEFAGDDSPVLEPLNFETTNDEVCISPSGDDCSSCSCVSCDVVFELPTDKSSLLRHLILVHKLVIADVNLITNINKYLIYWKKRFSELPLTEFCSVIQTNSKVTDLAPSEFYYLLCDTLPEDKELRLKLQIERLDQVLEQQNKERNDSSFSRMCLFCRHHFDGNRADLFNHMAEFHHFNVGHPDNLVYTNEFLNLLEEKLQTLKCLYCEKTFKDNLVLKEHMRKKRHKKLHEGNAAYHRFYVINYLEMGKNWKDIMSEDDRESRQSDGTAEESAQEDDWVESVESSDSKAVCLFCDNTRNSFEDFVQHLKISHDFDLTRLIDDLHLNYYQQIKLINFIRRQMRQNCCTFCLERFTDHDTLIEHLKTSGHMSRVPVSAVWDRAEYYFPTYEDDNLLHMLQTNDNDDDDDDVMKKESYGTGVFDESAPVYPEDVEVDEETIKELINLKMLYLNDK